jgi:hypothetical protein
LYGADKIGKGGKLGALRAEFAAVELFNGFGSGIFCNRVGSLTYVRPG